MRALLIVMLLVTAAAQAQSIDIKNARLGMTEVEVRQIFPSMRCDANVTTVSDRMCADLNNSYGGARAAILAALMSGEVTHISARFDSKEFDTIAAALAAKYGKPDESKTSTVTNRAGAKFEDTELTWFRGQERLRARRFAGTIDKSTVILISDKAMNESTERRKEETGSRAKDL